MSIRLQFTVVRGLHVQGRHEVELTEDLQDLGHKQKVDIDSLITAQPEDVNTHLAGLDKWGLRRVVEVFNKVRNSAMGVGVTAELSPHALKNAPATMQDEDRAGSVRTLNTLITAIQSRPGFDT